jgi:hypothetical protein
VEDRAAVAAIGVDPTRTPGVERYTFTFPNVTTTTSSLASISSARQFFTISVAAANLLQALAKVQRRESRTLYLGQVRIVCLSSRLPTATWQQCLNLLADSGRFVLTTWVVAAPNAASLVAAAPPTEVVPEVALYNALACRCQALRWPGRAWRLWAEALTPGVSPATVLVESHGAAFILTQLIVVGATRLSVWNPEATAGWAYLTDHVLRDTVTVPLKPVPVVVTLIRGHSQIAFHRRGPDLIAHSTLWYSGVLVGVRGGADAVSQDARVEV